MGGSKLPYILFLSVLFLFNFFIFLTPYLELQGDSEAEGLYAAFAPTCHQLTSRSSCLFVSKSDNSYSIGDCFPTSELSYSRANVVDYPDKTGYKFPVCSRDLALYLAMLLGLLALPFVQKMGSEDWPNKWLLVLAAIPVGIDGTGQLFGFWESTNMVRVITGAIIGFALPFYIMPILNSLYLFTKESIARLGTRKKRK